MFGKENMGVTHKELNMEDKMTKYKVKNLTGASVKFGDIRFEPYETKILEDCPTSDRFHTEKIEELKSKKVIKEDK